MVDLDKLQKINALAKQLKEHGIVTSMDDAYHQAEKMVDNGDTSLKNLPVNANIEVKPAAPEAAQAAPQQVSQSGNSINQLDFYNVQNKLTSVEQQLGQAFSKMNEMISEINKLQSQIQTMQLNAKPVHVEKQASLSSSSSSSSPAAKTEDHPRSGAYKPGDVAIEKMFYFGSGR